MKGSFVMTIHSRLKKTTPRKWTLARKGRVTGWLMAPTETHSPTMHILLPNNKKKPVASSTSKHSHSNRRHRNNHRGWMKCYPQTSMNHLEPSNCAQSGSPSAKKRGGERMGGQQQMEAWSTPPPQSRLDEPSLQSRTDVIRLHMQGHFPITWYWQQEER